MQDELSLTVLSLIRLLNVLNIGYSRCLVAIESDSSKQLKDIFAYFSAGTPTQQSFFRKLRKPLFGSGGGGIGSISGSAEFAW